MIETKRLKIYVATNAQMEDLIAQAEEDLKPAYREMLNCSLAHPDKREWYAVWMIELKDGVHAGEMCFKGVGEDGSVEIGYGIDENYRGRAIAQEAVGAVSKWALKQNGITCVFAEVEKENIASVKVLEKTGFEKTDKVGSEGIIYEMRNKFNLQKEC